MSRETRAGEATVTLVCETFGITRQAYYGARKPRPERKPPRRTPPLVSAEAALAAIRGIVDAHRAWGVRKIWATLRRQGLRVGRRRVWALMHANGLVLTPTPREPEPRRGHVVVPEPNRRLATDLTTVWTRDDGLVAVAITVDCGCRSVLDVTVTKSQSSPDILASVDRALESCFGEPSNVPEGVELRSDHGPQYTGADAAQLARRWGIVQTFAPVGRPTGNAVAERTIRTMKEECVWLADWTSAEALRSALLAWQKCFNTERPHQSLAWRTPAEYRAERLPAEPLRKAA